MSARLPLADIEFIASFAAFCRTKGDEGYDYDSVSNCACAQFLKSREPKFFCTGGDCWADTGHGWHSLLVGLGMVNFGNGDHRFSALADRLEALLVDAPVVERG